MDIKRQTGIRTNARRLNLIQHGRNSPPMVVGGVAGIWEPLSCSSVEKGVHYESVPFGNVPELESFVVRSDSD